MQWPTATVRFSLSAHNFQHSKMRQEAAQHRASELHVSSEQLQALGLRVEALRTSSLLTDEHAHTIEDLIGCAALKDP